MLGPVRPALLVLMAAVLVVLLVACVNSANLLLARGAARARDVAVRRALGARDGRLARQFLTESAVLTLLASALGVGLAYGALHLLLAIAPPDVPRLAEVSVDLRVLAVTLAASAVVAVGFGMVPTLQARRVDVNTALKREAGRASAGRERRRVREALVVAEFALAVVLVVGAGLLIKSFWRLQQVNPGFRSAGVLKAEYQLPASRYPVVMAQWPNFPEVRTFTEELLRRASAEPGVESAALAANHPLDPGFTSSIMVAGRESEAHDWPEISIRRVTPGYFRTVGLGLDQGRLLRDADDVTAAPVVLINRAAARRFFAGRNPLGAAIKLWGADRTVVGVVEDERSHGLAQEAPVALYAPLAQTPSLDGAGVLLLRTRGDPLGLAAAAQRLVHDVDPGLAVFGIEPLPLTVSRSLSRPRFTMLVLGLFAGVALVLAAVGVHGVLSYAVLQRSREIGIRVALGAGPLSVVGMIAREGLTLAGAGLGFGLAGALALTRQLRSLLYGTEPTDPATLIAVCAVLAAVALAASSYPALRAARVDPAETLRLDG